MTSWRVLRLLGLILLVVLWFLVAWTSAVCQSPSTMTRALISTGLTPQGLQFSMCLLDHWDYMMAVGECVGGGGGGLWWWSVVVVCVGGLWW